MDLFELTKGLIDIPSVTGDEGALADFLVRHLRDCGFSVREQAVAGTRRNIFATGDPKPLIVLCTHMDTVPGPSAAAEDDKYIFGRGSCDAKGILAAMIAAAQALIEDGVRRIGLLFVVGEETDSVGAKMANALDPGSRFVIVGEPTGNKLGSGHKGILTVRLKAKGRRAHSAFPKLGESAVEKLLDALAGIRSMDLDEDPVLGSTLMNIGLIEGGVAPNVIPDSAEAVVSFRTAATSETVLARLVRTIGPLADVEVLTKSDPQVLFTLSGFEATVLPYGSDVPHLKAFGRPLLIGPGSALDAHTDGEKIEKKQLRDAVEIYNRLVRELLAEK